MVISIVIATFNAGNTLSRCLESIIAQKGSNIEILVIDGGSQDDTLLVISKYASDIAFYCSEKDEGIYDAWNKALMHTKGDWIMFLGADDYLLPGALLNYMDFIERNEVKDVDIISGKCEYVDEKGNLLSVNGSAYDFKIFRKYMNISHGSTLHNVKLFKELGPFNLKYKICADYEFLLRKALNSRFVDKSIICMQSGGMSYSFRAIIETFNIRREKGYISLTENLILFIKGFASLGFRKIWDSVLSK